MRAEGLLINIRQADIKFVPMLEPTYIILLFKLPYRPLSSSLAGRVQKTPYSLYTLGSVLVGALQSISRKVVLSKFTPGNVRGVRDCSDRRRHNDG
jgi:hypothetical protein